MNRQQKEAVVSEFRAIFEKAHAAFLVNYRGIVVADMQVLRRGLRHEDGVFKVTKVRLMKISASDIDGIGGFKNNFKNQVGLVFAFGEVSCVAKKLVDFSKEHKTFKIVSAFFEKSVISEEQIKALAALPSREVLLAQVVCGLKSPVAGFVAFLRMMLVRLIHTLQQIADKKSKRE